MTLASRNTLSLHERSHWQFGSRGHARTARTGALARAVDHQTRAPRWLDQRPLCRSKRIYSSTTASLLSIRLKPSS